MLEKVTACRVCTSTELTKFLDFGEQPFANALLKSPEDRDPRYPLALLFCNTCSLVQLTHKVGEKELFSQYVWVTGTSKAIHAFSEVFCDELIARGGDTQNTYVLEIASNDGTLLKPFKKRGFEVLGIDPAKNIADMANTAGIKTRALFWGKDIAEKIVQEKGKSKIVFARNVLPHVNNQRDFVGGLATALAEDGVLAIEVHYAGVILRELHYDSIYHEHHCYFSLKTLEKLLNDFGLYIFDLMESPVSGGSLIVYARKQKGEESVTLHTYRNKEAKERTNVLETWQEFNLRSDTHCTKLLSMLKELQKAGEIVMGYGASARSSTMLNFCGINSAVLPLIADKNPLKQGLYTAGTHIPIVPIEKMLEQKPTTIFILAWNFKDEIMDELQKVYRYRGKFLIPFPDPLVLIS